MDLSTCQFWPTCKNYLYQLSGDIYIYIYREREREREKEIDRERDRERERVRENRAGSVT